MLYLCTELQGPSSNGILIIIAKRKISHNHFNVILH
jgi:hypothetical protein